MPALERTQLAENVVEELWFGDEDPQRTHYEASQSMAAAAAAAAGLKPFPAVAARVMRLLSDVDTPAHKLVTAIEGDPALAGRILRVANSALYGAASPISDIGEAVVRLGNRNVTEIVSGVATIGLFSDVKGLGQRFRDHCVGVAAIARTLSTEWKFRGVRDLFVASLLHDVGKLLTMQVGELDYTSMPEEVTSAADRTHGEERRLVGWDHAVLGAHVLELWQLPSGIARIVAWHHQPGRAYATDGQLGLAVAMLRMADALEIQIATSPERDDAFVEALCEGGDASYTGYSAEIVGAMWPKLVAARSEMLTVLTS